MSYWRNNDEGHISLLIYINMGVKNYKKKGPQQSSPQLQYCLREASKIKNRLNLGHSPNHYYEKRLNLDLWFCGLVL
jgi:hypothetical protein